MSSDYQVKTIDRDGQPVKIASKAGIFFVLFGGSASDPHPPSAEIVDNEEDSANASV